MIMPRTPIRTVEGYVSPLQLKDLTQNVREGNYSIEQRFDQTPPRTGTGWNHEYSTYLLNNGRIVLASRTFHEFAPVTDVHIIPSFKTKKESFLVEEDPLAEAILGIIQSKTQRADEPVEIEE